MSTIILNKAELGDALKNCVEGQPETLTVTFTPTAVNDAVVVGEISAAEYVAGEEPVEEEVAEEAAEKPYRPKARKGSATAVDYSA